MHGFSFIVHVPQPEAIARDHSSLPGPLGRGHGRFSSVWVSDHLMKGDIPIL
jgi:hypothetical protein